MKVTRLLTKTIATTAISAILFTTISNATTVPNM